MIAAKVNLDVFDFAFGQAVGDRVLRTDGLLATFEFRFVLGELLSAQAAKARPQVLVRPQGERRVWLEMAERNATQAIAQRLREYDTQDKRLGALREAMGLDEGLARIERFNPVLRAYITVCADAALEAAREAERDIAAGRYRGPLHGLPFGVKDQVCTRGVRTTLGSRIYADYVPDFDAAVINTNYALEAGLNPKTDALIQESRTNNPYGNFIAVHQKNKDKPEFKILVAAYQSKEVAAFLEQRFKGAVLPAW